MGIIRSNDPVALSTYRVILYQLFNNPLITSWRLYFMFLNGKKQNIFRIWQHPRHWMQLVIFAILGMLGAQYVFIETVHISNAVTATLFQFLGPVLITIYVAVQHKNYLLPCKY